MRERIGEFWFWKASRLLPPEYGGQNYSPQVSISNFKKHNEGTKELDFAVLDEMYEEFSKLKLVRYAVRGWLSQKTR